MRENDAIAWNSSISFVRVISRNRNWTKRNNVLINARFCKCLYKKEGQRISLWRNSLFKKKKNHYLLEMFRHSLTHLPYYEIGTTSLLRETTGFFASSWRSKIGNTMLPEILHVVMIAASVTSTMSIQVEGSVWTPSTGKCLTDEQLGKLHLETIFWVTQI